MNIKTVCLDSPEKKVPYLNLVIRLFDLSVTQFTGADRTFRLIVGELVAQHRPWTLLAVHLHWTDKEARCYPGVRFWWSIELLGFEFNNSREPVFPWGE